MRKQTYRRSRRLVDLTLPHSLRVPVLWVEMGVEGASHLVIPCLSRAKPCAHSIQFTDDRQSRKVTHRSAQSAGFPPRSTAFWTEGGGSSGRAHPGGGGGDCLPGRPGLEGDSSSTYRAHDSGPSGPLPVTTGYGVNGSVVTGCDVLVTVETGGCGEPP